MRDHIFFHITIAASLLVLALSLAGLHSRTAVAAEEEVGIFVDVDEVRIGDRVNITGIGMEPGGLYNLYFASDNVGEGSDIDGQVTSYVLLERNVNASDENDARPGEFRINFDIPELLDDGEDVEDVHGGEYYVYATLRASSVIVEKAILDIYGGEITLSPESGIVGSELEINGEGLRPEQTVTIKFDGLEQAIAGGDTVTDAEGRFSGTILIPEASQGAYIVRAIDESGNKPEAEFSIEPAITVSPASQDVDGTVNVSGTGFRARERVEVMLGNIVVTTVPYDLHTTRLGSLGGSFVIPPDTPFTEGGSFTVRVKDESEQWAQTALDVRPILASINLSPETSAVAPGHVGMELTVSGVWFAPDRKINITYENGNSPLTVATQSSGSRVLSLKLTVPPGEPGSHQIIADDGNNQAGAVFIMEGKPPSTPALLSPGSMAEAAAQTAFDWEDVTDPSGVSYTLEISRDDDFVNLLLQKNGLGVSAYELTAAEKLIISENAHYWRVRAIDGTGLTSDWSAINSFYVEDTAPAGSKTPIYAAIGAGAAAAVAGVMIRRRRTD